MSTRAKAKPVHIARAGSVSVPVYRYAEGRWCVAWRQCAGEPRTRKTFSVKAEAITKAEEVARALANSLGDVVTLTSADRDNYRLAVQALAPLGIPLHAAISEYVEARKRVAPYSLLDAAAAYPRARQDESACPSTSLILAELLAELADDRRESRKYIAPLERDLKRFADAFPDLRAVGEGGLREYLRGLTLRRAFKGREAGEAVSARRRDNVREAIVRIMRFARKKGYLPADKTPAAELIPKLSEGAEVSTYSPEQIAQILTYFATRDRDWLPWAAIAAFAGLRTSEIMRLEWSALRWVLKTIPVKRSVGEKCVLLDRCQSCQLSRLGLAIGAKRRGLSSRANGRTWRRHSATP